MMMNGCGAKEHHNITSMLGLPSPKSTTKKYNQMVQLLHEKIIEAGKVSVCRALEEEVEKQFKVDNKEYRSTWQQFVLTNSNFMLGLNVSYDMGWNKRSSGQRYDSLSGHGLMIGSQSRKIIGVEMKSKFCAICSYYETLPTETVTPPHNCSKNYLHSSKAMEADSCLDLVTRIFNNSNGNIFIKTITSDDDSTMQAVLKHEGKGKGRLNVQIPEPRWLADPTHRIKVVAKGIYKLAAAANKISRQVFTAKKKSSRVHPQATTAKQIPRVDYLQRVLLTTKSLTKSKKISRIHLKVA